MSLSELKYDIRESEDVVLHANVSHKRVNQIIHELVEMYSKHDDLSTGGMYGISQEEQFMRRAMLAAISYTPVAPMDTSELEKDITDIEELMGSLKSEWAKEDATRRLIVLYEAIGHRNRINNSVQDRQLEKVENLRSEIRDLIPNINFDKDVGGMSIETFIVTSILSVIVGVILIGARVYFTS